jgi:riboflavin kinase/FMN adenylyltransferase
MRMKVTRSPEEWAAQVGATARATITVGNFDGLHRGHQKILSETLERARRDSAVAGAVTFDPHPLKVLRPAEAPPLICTLEQRLAGLEAAGLDAVLILNFDRALSLLSPEEFVRDILVSKLNMRAILVGENFRFGHRGSGDVAQLRALGRQHGFEVHTIAPVEAGGELVSSTAIRQAVQRGNVEHASALLGRPFSLTGNIVAGAGRGAKVLFPTLNLAAEQELLPARGVYATETLLGSRCFRSATNVGVRPTFDGAKLTIESHLFEFDERVTNGRLEVRFWKRLRDERKFSGVDELRSQIGRDLEQARDYFTPGYSSGIKG